MSTTIVNQGLQIIIQQLYIETCNAKLKKHVCSCKENTKSVQAGLVLYGLVEK